jgi:hypothetical protein
MRTVISAAVLCSLTAFSVAQEQPNSQDKQNSQDYAVYEATFRLGKELFLEIYKQDGAVVRTAAILYQIPEGVTRWGFPNRCRSDSKWRTKEVRHVGSDTVAV